MPIRPWARTCKIRPTPPRASSRFHLLTRSRPESTASVASTILAYRTIHGRSFHSERDDNRGHFTPNDEQQMESVDIAHHTLTLLLDGKLFLAPIGDNPQVRGSQRPSSMPAALTCSLAESCRHWHGQW